MENFKLTATVSLLLSLLIISCSEIEPNSFIIKGNTDLIEGTSVYRVESGPNGQAVTVDSTKVVESAFEFKGFVDQIDINFIFIKGVNGNVPVILEEGIIETKIYKDSLSSSTIGGTNSNNDLAEYRISTKDFSEKLQSIVKEINQANAVGDNLLVEDLTSEYRSIEQELSLYEKGFMNSNPSSYIASLILERLLTTQKILQPEAAAIFNGFDQKIKESVSGKKVNTIISKPINPTAIGAKALNFEGPNPEGEILSLESLKGKVTIIDFWASWCRPCRIENPNLVRLYKRMHDKGLEIVGVSLDKSKVNWERAIEDDGLIWNHVSSLQYWKEPIAVLYGVRSIPEAFVLNEDGVIVAKNLRGAQLDAKIEELLGE
ncbi:AhpC/TSA family protein [Flavobacteriaceae bacterium]|uniref:TlpA disulfide reductase family protein n=1 Tax=Candidatus Arcticimaribacter forsetii TaxID=2820661 RepID=UPI0020771487|nr:TlpA disulfide reductase family protein [Candidatus Arcticimaribacter forsetii]MDB2325621.1 AhpC/TSA family protein [Flavobacteriaceae bacterium]MDB2345763.1 AhpC/TSA family protein [Flavobacteriaceae bacterium]MDB4620601.1 AhpC/TSA family protein [Flavobacteriaceae bacterium]MDB4674438.1 AhpC/TSA family protein [Flavobacteriaceae bacterium]MDB4751491.1 AhpC/TSA family protein [Flavobacteriaceae bacterium]